jgi:hypothetical protein
MRIQYTHIHPIYGKLEFLCKSEFFKGYGTFIKEDKSAVAILISEVEVYQPNNLTNIPHIAPEPTYSGTY